MLRQRLLGVSVLVLFAAALAACGGGGGGGGGLDSDPGVGTITVTSFSPNPIVGCAPTPFTITGTNFETVTGTTALVTFRALGGATPFAHGTVDRATVVANVTSDTTIDGISPQALICGVPSVTVEIDVTLESGVTTTSTGIFTVVINAPTLTSILPNPIPAALPTPFTITGTGFGPVGGPVTVRFTGDGGALLWKDGTKNFADVVGTIVSSTTITGVTPIATVCDVPFIGASLQLFFTDGCCTLPTAPGFVVFIPPAVTSVAPNPVPAAIATTLTVTGSNFGQVGNVATVRMIADGGFNIFSDGTKNTLDVPAVITSPTTLSLLSPVTTVCGVASRSVALRVIAPYGSSCTQTAAGFLTFVAPTLASVAPNPVAGAIQTPLTLTGTNFGPTGSPVVVRFVADLGRDLFADGTTHEIDVSGVIATSTTVTLLSPLATICNLASAGSQVIVFAPSGNSCAISGAGFVTFNAPTLTSIAPNPIPSGLPTPFTITGTGFGPTGSPATVTFVADGGLALFGNASLNAIDVPGTVTAGTTITGVAPTATLCQLASAGAAVRVTLQNGSCVQSAAAFVSFTAPSVTSVVAASVPAAIPTIVTVNGTGFFPTGGVALVTFITDGAPALFGDGTQAQHVVAGTITGPTTVTVLTPHATVVDVLSRTATLRVTLPNGSCALSAAGALTFLGPTLASMTSPLQSSIPTAFTITGANFGPTGSQVIVRFVADSGTPFANGDSGVFEVPGLVTASTTITGTAPLAALCGPAYVGAAVRITLQDGSSVQSAAAFTTFTAPTATSIAPPTVPASIPTLVTITGTGFGPIGGVALVRLVGDGGATIFGDGTLNVSSTMNGSITSSTTITFTTPRATVSANTGASATVTLPSGACATTPATAITFLAPTIASIAVGPFPAAIPTAFTLTGANFGPTGSEAIVRFIADGGVNVFGNASHPTIDVPGVVTGPTTITGTTPLAAVCLSATQGCAIRIQLQDGSSAQTAATFMTFTGPTIATTSVPSTAWFQNQAFTLTGTGFGPTGAQVLLRFSATGGLSLFADGTSPTYDAVGTVTAATTITGVYPRVTHCVPTVGSLGGTPASVTSTLRAVLPGGACADSPAAFVTHRLPQLDGTFFAPVGGLVPMSNPTLLVMGGTDLGVGATAIPITFTFSGGGFVYNLDNGGVGTSDFDQELGTINGGATHLLVTSPRVASSSNFTGFIRGTYEDGTCTNTISFTWVAPPAITAVTNAAGPFDQGAVASILNDRFIGVVSTQMNIAGTGFSTAPAATVTIRNANTNALIGTGALTGQTTAAALITGGSPTDASLLGTIPVRVRVTNGDGQFSEALTTYVTSAVRPNLNASQVAGTQAETHMAVNPANPLNAVAFAHRGGAFSSMHAAVTIDGGATWTSVAIGATQDGFGAGSFRGDPMVAFDKWGNCYFNYICAEPFNVAPALDRQILIQFAPTGAPATVTSGILGAAANAVRVLRSTASTGILTDPVSANQDRNTIAVGPAGPFGPAGADAVYCAWTDFTVGTGQGEIVYAACSSTAAGNLSGLTGPVVVAGNGANVNQHGAPSVGPSGEVYVTWVVADFSSITNVSGTATINCRVDLDGIFGGGGLGATNAVATADLGGRSWSTAMPNRGYGTIPMNVTIPTGGFAGRVVITYSDEAPPTSQATTATNTAINMRVVVRYSDNFGASWSAPIYVHPLTLDHHFHSWMAVDRSTGNAYISWYDTVDAGRTTVVRRCSSTTSGAAWNSPLLLSQGQSNAANLTGNALANEWLEYNGIAAHGHRVYACWGDNANFTGNNPDGTAGVDLLISVFEHKP